VQEKSSHTKISKTLKIKYEVKCNCNKSIFIGYTKWQRISKAIIYKNIDTILNKNVNLKLLHSKNQRPRFTLAKVISIQNWKSNKIIYIKQYYKYIIGHKTRDNIGDYFDEHQLRTSRNKDNGRHTTRNSGKTKEKRRKLVESKTSHLHSNNYLYNEHYNRCKRVIILSGDIEMNPGPNQNVQNDKLSSTKLRIMTYNVQGLGAMAKLKRVNNILHKLDDRESYFINIQETHFKNELTINYQWKWGVVQSLGTSNSAGVAILYSKSFFDDIIETRKDKEGRFCSITLTKNGEHYTFLNIYAPNNHYDSLTFMKYVECEIDDIILKFPLTNLTISGDLNFVLSSEVDSIGRNQTRQEKIVVNVFKDLAIKYNLIDSFRSLNEYGGYTWGKNNPTYLRSRLDYIYVNEELCNKLSSSYVTYTFNESDHNPVTSEFEIDFFTNGPGIIRGNATLLEKPEIRERVEKELDDTIKEMPSNWNPHQKLDYYKYKLRIILLKEGKNKARIDKTRLEQANLELGRLNKQLDAKLQKLECKKETNNIKLLEQIESLKSAITISEHSTKDLKDEEARKLIFRSRAKWSEQGEKSNKYFLNLVKERQRKMQIRKIVSNGVSYYKQDEISKEIEKYYTNLYKKQPNLKKVDLTDSKFNSLPSLSNNESDMLKADLTIDELKVTLNTCTESAPGPDGISYDVYKQLWATAGPMILNAWNYSNKIGITSISQRESIITLLDKKDKDRTKIENLRPISLSNCDIKLCTKALALRTSKVVHLLVDRNQTGYVPGRQVTDNIRLLEEIIEEANNSKKESFLITLDAQKAFDSVDHDYLIEILKLYKFPKEYIRWIQILYTDLNASVLVNGFTTAKFKIEQSVKQGDALSCVLFILAIEPLIQGIKRNPLIKPVLIQSKTSDRVEEIKTATYADDITSLTSNKESIQVIIDEYESFSTFSGIKLNVQKTEILIMGHETQGQIEFELYSKGNPITINNHESVKVCGITLSNNKDLAYKDNVIIKIIKLERQLDIWRSRNLTLQGKILIVKTFGISQLIYSFQSTYVKNDEL